MEEKCRLYLKGSVNGEKIRPIALQTRNLGVAICEVEKMIDERNVSRGLTVADAVEEYLRKKINTLVTAGADLTIEAGICRSDTIRKLSDILFQLEEFCTSEKIAVKYLGAISTEHLEAFQNTWKGLYDYATQTYAPKSQIGKQKISGDRSFILRVASRTWTYSPEPSCNLGPNHECEWEETTAS